MIPASHSFPADSEGRQYSLQAQRLAVGTLAVALSVASIALIAASAPWQVRFFFVAAAFLGAAFLGVDLAVGLAAPAVPFAPDIERTC